MPPSVPAIDGWFTTTAEPALIGTRCSACGSYFFPPERNHCRNPACASEELAEVELSRRGRIWSVATNHYAAPPPFVAKEPFEPYTVVAVELPREQMVVLGMLADDGDPATVAIGDDVELTTERLLTDADGNEHIVWKWRPVP